MKFQVTHDYSVTSVGENKNQMTQSIIGCNQKIINMRITYKNAPIHTLEKFTFKNSDLAYKKFKECGGLDHCIIIQTCNRVEVYGCSKKLDEYKIINVWASLVELSSDDFLKVIQISKGKSAVLHLLKLASGLDSLVIGEDQILRQVKRSLELSRVYGYSGFTLSFLFDKAIRVGSKVRTLTQINKGSISIGSIAVNLAEEHFDNLGDKQILLIGSGEGASLVAKSLKQRDLKFIITSRTVERAKSFSEAVGGKPIPFDIALATFNEFDLIFVSITAPYYLVTFERMNKAMCNRNKSMMIFDLSNPRTVEERVASINRVKLLNIDQLSGIVEENMGVRRNEIVSAEKIIKSEFRSIDSILKRRKADPVINSIFKNANIICEGQLRTAQRLLADKVGAEEIRIIEQLSHAILESIISVPMNNLRREIEIHNGREEELIRIVSKLFNYEKEISLSACSIKT